VAYGAYCAALEEQLQFAGVTLSMRDNNKEPAQEINWESSSQEKLLRYKTAIFLGYNYYRLFLAGCLLLLYFYVPDQQFVGKDSPELFKRVISAYFAMNLAFAMIPPSWCARMVLGNVPVFTVLCADIIFFGLQMYASGGINGILGNFLIVPVAFSGVLVNPRFSIACASLGCIVSFYAEFNLYVRELNTGSDGFYEAGLLGIALFVISILFQYLAQQVRKRNEEISTLEQFHQMEQLARRTQDELAATDQRFKVLLQSAGEGVLGLERDGAISFANRRAGHILDCPSETLIGRNIASFLVESPESDDSAQDAPQILPVQKILQTVSLYEGKQYDPHSWQTAGGDQFFVEYSCEPVKSPSGDNQGAVVVFQDVTKRKEDEARLSHLANFDTLTDLANRAYFNHTLHREVARASRRGSLMAVMYIDMDRFKYYNDSLGHAGGDDILKAVASRLKKSVRESDVVARLGGDEFAVVLVDLHSPENATQVAEAIQENVRQDVQVAGKRINPSVSVGIAFYDADGQDVHSLLQAADTALYAAKDKGGSSYRCFQRDMQRQVEEKRRIQTLLGSAVQRQEFQLYYQPVYSVRDGSIHSMEALIRWTPGNDKPVEPNVFIPIAEDSGQMGGIGNWVISEACRQASEWREELGTYPRIAVNISTRQLATDEFRAHFQRQMQVHRVPAGVIDLELTETAMMNDPEFVMAELTQLHDLGIRISIDDFGTGYSSLDYLRRLPLDFVKIDQSFTRGIGVSRNDEELIRLMITMAHTLGLRVIAEGVESREQEEFLEGLDCDLVQGYFHCPPRPGPEVLDELRNQYKSGTAGKLDGLQGAP
jgi:diguanylate cyclase (GGDEF)-like protein/PAS domain S-box-containing protein